ncbi:hypothetical protein M422DRAFT_51235 [Sphaerobolus stellatus SS14]|uniref:Unplaced genomic scaffold SPHSTscaffold_107, whole genome shotgun sequence n=1 Tax=Sphaerobolus stellatus (strain SS14) TaxID=990650 RepID=A0A0C9VF39_SPHS4|nr:hypothetical protein M422DRAFT_51235 [Sphaerobolus stellatus SS14]
MQGGKHAQHVFELLLKRANEVLVAIVTYAADGERPVLRVGGKLGLFPGLRAVEFLRCYVHTADKGTEKMAVICFLLDRYDSTLVKEAWQRWAIINFVQSKHDKAGLLFKAWLVWMETVMQAEATEDQWYKLQRSNARPQIVDDIAQCAGKQVRLIQTHNFGVPYLEEQWATPEIRKEVQAWVKDEASLDMTNASVLDVFLWMYSLFMISSHGGESESAWCKKAIQKTIQELLDARPNLTFWMTGRRLSGMRLQSLGSETDYQEGQGASAAVPTEKVIRATRNLRKPASQKPESQGVRSSECLSDKKEVDEKMDQKKS